MTHRLATCLICVFAVTIATSSIGTADLTNITDGTNTFQWDPDDGTTLLAASFDTNYSFAFTPMLRYRRPPGGFGGGLITTVPFADLTSGADGVDSNSVINAGDTGSQHIDIQFTQVLPPSTTDLFDVDLSFTISSTPAGDTTLNYTMTVTNVSGVDRPDVELFSYFDWDLINNQNSGEDFTIGSFTGFIQRVNPAAGDPVTMNAFHGTDDFQNWEVADWDSIETKLLANGNLTNSGTPYAVADMTGAFGWDLGTMAAGESFTVNLFITTFIDTVEAVVPEGSKFLDGFPSGGTLADVFESDDQYFELEPSFTKNLIKQKIELVVQSTSPTDTPTDFKFRLESVMLGGPSGDVIQTIEMFDYTTGFLELMDLRSVAISDESIEITPAGDVTRFIQPITNEITTHIVWESESFTGTPFNWSIDLDEAVWLISD